MRNIFSEFSNLWPEASRKSLAPLLSQIPVFFFPEERGEIERVANPKDCVIVMNDSEVRHAIELVSMGYEHCIQRSRPDFAQELLASALMVSRPDAFVKNPVPFFFTGFSPASSSVETNFTLSFAKTSDKKYLLEKLTTFLSQNPRLQGISDLCVQVADELISNALFSSPVDEKGKSLNQEIERSQEVILPAEKKATFFACFSEYRVVIGCEDSFGSFRKRQLIEHFEKSFFGAKISARGDQHAGAGLGFRYIIENSANFYLYCQSGRRSLVAAAFLLQGLRANMLAKRHFHISIR